jgi:hypothetical protein
MFLMKVLNHYFFMFYHNFQYIEQENKNQTTIH